MFKITSKGTWKYSILTNGKRCKLTLKSTNGLQKQDREYGSRNYVFIIN